MIPSFQPNGLLPPGDYEVSFEELRQSVLADGPPATSDQSWDRRWRRRLIDNLETLSNQLWQVGVRDIYADGSFAEDKDHPNDIDGYFVCGLKKLASGELARQLNLLDPYKVWTWDPLSRKPYRGYPKKQLPMCTATGSNSTLTCPASAWGPASWTDGETNSNFRPHSASPGVMGHHEASSKSNMESPHDPQRS
jgi:hypothetical protein